MLKSQSCRIYFRIYDSSIYLLCIQVVGGISTVSSQYYVTGFQDLLDTIIILIDEFCLINGGK